DAGAAADVDDVTGEHVLVDVRRTAVAAEERQVRGLATSGLEGAVEANDVVVGIPRRGGQEADPRSLAAAQLQDVVVEQRVTPLHREAAAAEGDDLPPVSHRRSVVRDRANVSRPPVGTRSTGCPTGPAPAAVSGRSPS